MFSRILYKMGFEGFRHQRSKSIPENQTSEENNSVQSTEAANGSNLDTEPTNDCTDSKKKVSSNAETQLRQEIQMLEKRLQDQVSIRCALENALGYRSSSEIIVDASAIPKAPTELIKDISVLEVEVGHLEHYLLSVYRKAFDSLSSPKKSTKESKPKVEYQALPNVRTETSEEKLLDSSNVQHSHSSLSQRSSEAMGKALRPYHSQPLSMIEYAPNTKKKMSDVKSVIGDSKGVPSNPENDGTSTFDSKPNEGSSGKKENLQPMPSMVSTDHNTSDAKEKKSDVIGDSNGVPCTDAYKPTSPENHGTKIFDSTPIEASGGKEETLQPMPCMVSVDHNTSNTKRKRSNVKNVLGSSPWTRSRARNATKAK